MAEGPTTAYIAGRTAGEASRLRGLQIEEAQAMAPIRMQTAKNTAQVAAQNARQGAKKERIQDLLEYANLAEPITDMSERNALLNKYIEKTKTRGSDPGPFMDLLPKAGETPQQTLAKQNALFAPIRQTAVQLGFSTKPAVTKEVKPGQPKTFNVLNKKTGKFEPRSLQFAGNTAYLAGTNTVVPATDFRPIAKKGMSVKLPDGTEISVGGDAGPGLTPAVKTDIQKRMTNNVENLTALKKIQGMKQDRFLNVQGWWDEKFQGAKSFLDPLLPDEMKQTLNEKKEYGELVAFRSKSKRALSNYIKGMSGVAVSDKEATRLMAGFPNPKDNPVGFDAKMSNLINELETRHRIYYQLMANGFEGDQEERLNAIDRALLIDDGTLPPDDELDKIGAYIANTQKLDLQKPEDLKKVSLMMNSMGFFPKREKGDK